MIYYISDIYVIMNSWKNGSRLIMKHFSHPSYRAELLQLEHEVRDKIGKIYEKINGFVKIMKKVI